MPDRRRKPAASKRTYRLELRLTRDEARLWIQAGVQMGYASLAHMVRQAVARHLDEASRITPAP